MTDDRLLDGSDEQSVSDELEIVEREGSFDSDPVQVNPAAEQQITGTTSIAPGSELTVRVRSSGDTQPWFVKSQTVTVSEERTWNATFGFSEQAAGDTFNARLRGGSFETAEASGEVVEEATPTPTEEPTEEPTDEPTETTEEETPGFGVIVALVALVAAALLAVRRD